MEINCKERQMDIAEHKDVKLIETYRNRKVRGDDLILKRQKKKTHC